MNLAKHFIAIVRPVLTRSTLLFMVVLICAGIFALIVDSVRDGDTLYIEQSILRDINSYSSSFLDTFFVYFTHLADTITIIVATGVLLLASLQRRTFQKAFFVLGSMLGAGLINVFLKLLFERPRPMLWERLVQESSFSFPSGHAMGSCAIALTVVILLWGSKFRVLSIVAGSTYVLLIGLSRMYLGVHYPSDILGGWLISILWVSTFGALLIMHESWQGVTKPADNVDHDS